MPDKPWQENAPLDNPERVTYFAETDARGKRVPFGIKAKDRTRHMYVIGKTGMGKSTMLENLAIQDIQNGEGLTFIDPHGSTAEKLLEYVPKERAKDVLYFAPFDLQYPVSFNVMENVDADKRHLVVNGLMATFEKIWADAWSARMAYILQNTLLALLEYPGATLLGVNRMYTDKDFRKKVIDHLTDPTARAFWVDEYSKYTDRYTQEATPAIQNKIGQFASNPLIRNIIGQSHSAFNLREMMDTRKILIINLSKGRVGEGNANLLGSMFITKLYLAAMSRAELSPQQLTGLPDHYLYVDEFQNFANRSFADILSEARKYKLALTVAHQYIEQMEEEVRAAVFGNVGTMISFRVGSYDAEILEKEFAPVFVMQDLVNLGFSQIYLKLMIDGVSSQPFSARTLPPVQEPQESSRDLIVANSRRQYAKPRADVEEAVREWHKPIDTSTPPRERIAGVQATVQTSSRNERNERERSDSKDQPVRRDVRTNDERPPMRRDVPRDAPRERSRTSSNERVSEHQAGPSLSDMLKTMKSVSEQTRKPSVSELPKNTQAVQQEILSPEKQPERLQEQQREQQPEQQRVLERIQQAPQEATQIKERIPQRVSERPSRERQRGVYTESGNSDRNPDRNPDRSFERNPDRNQSRNSPSNAFGTSSEHTAQRQQKKPLIVKKDSKGMSEGDKETLRAALAGLVQPQATPNVSHQQEAPAPKSNIEQSQQSDTTEFSPKRKQSEMHKEHAERKKAPPQTLPTKEPAEIPEQELRNMLEVEDK